MIGLLLRLYPAKWRERYGEELVEMVQETGGLTPHMAVDIVGCALRTRLEAGHRRLVSGPAVAVSNGSGLAPGIAILGAVAIVPTVVFGLFGLAFTVLGIPVEPFIPIVRVAFEVLPMSLATNLLPLVGLLAAVLSLVLGGAGRTPRELVASAWSTSPAASLVSVASMVALSFGLAGWLA